VIVRRAVTELLSEVAAALVRAAPDAIIAAFGSITAGQEEIEPLPRCLSSYCLTSPSPLQLLPW
jgi:hypothetical protein